jgi:hypothetical protein
MPEDDLYVVLRRLVSPGTVAKSRSTAPLAKAEKPPGKGAWPTMALVRRGPMQGKHERSHVPLEASLPVGAATSSRRGGASTSEGVADRAGGGAEDDDE